MPNHRPMGREPVPKVISIRLLGLLFILIQVFLQPASGQQRTSDRPSAPVQTQSGFVPGEIWLDSKRRPINAHGGGMLYHGQTYYWYGENKIGRSWIPEANRKWDGYRVEVTGIRCYSSKDLYQWKDQGLVLKAVPQDPASDLHPSKVVERPKVAFNPKTRKFVMWMHIDTADYQSARAGVAIADSPTGHFKYLGGVKPEGGDSRDQTLFVDDDGKAYRVYSSEWNKATYISLLSEDWLKHTGRYVKVFAGQSLEAQAVFKRQGKYYLLASECSGWDPNPMHAAVADSIWGPWRELGNPCLGPNADISFQAQSTYVFQVAGKEGAYIFMADRWHKSNLSDSRYVWLPVLFGDDGPRLKWMSKWDLTFFDPNDRSGKNPAETAVPRGFCIRTNGDRCWLVRPDGTQFFFFGVCVVDLGSSRETFCPTNPGYAAFQHYSDSNAWAAATLNRLKSWNFTTIGGWSDYRAFQRCCDVGVAFTPVLHVGSTAGVPWWDMWDTNIIARMHQVARDQILPLRDDPRLLGYYSDNEIGWWNATLFKMTLEQAPTSGQRRRLVSLLRETYRDNWTALLKDFESENAASFENLEQHGMLYLRPGGQGIRVYRQFLGLMAQRYYALVKEVIRTYDPRGLILGDRYQSFYYPEVVRAGAQHVDVVSGNLNAAWNDGTFPRYYLDTLHALSGKPVLVSEFYMAAQHNRSGNRNDRSTFPTVLTQKQRAAGFRTTVQSLAQTPCILGADWFQYYDEPTHGRGDGENFNFGFVDIHDRPYEPLAAAASGLDLTRLHNQPPPARPDASLGVPPAPRNPLGQFTITRALELWDRERGFVKPVSDAPIADLYLSWNSQALYLGLYAQDIVETDYYRNKVVPEIDRAEWIIDIGSLKKPIRVRLGPFGAPICSEPAARIANLSGIYMNTRNIAAVELPAKLFGKTRFQSGDPIKLASTFFTHARADRIDWRGTFALRCAR
jgi:Glycosyl hydrolases family 43